MSQYRRMRPAFGNTRRRERPQRSFEMKRKDDLKAVFGTAARAFTLILAAAALLAFAECGSESDSVPDGGWESTVDGIKIMLFTQNGRMFGINEEDNHDGETPEEIEYIFASGKGTIYFDSDEGVPFTLSGNTLTITNTVDNEEAVFTKVSKPEKSRFNGLWISKDFMMKLNEAGKGAVITTYVGPGGNIIIPATIQVYLSWRWT
jgi:hypothetical protein